MHFHEDEIFQLCDVDINYEDLSTENSNPRLSPSAPGIDKARLASRDLNQSSENKTSKNLEREADELDYTISEDLSDGLLFEDGDNLILNSEGFEDDEIHLIEKVVPITTDHNNTENSSGYDELKDSQSLQDYQMQLMLLEQQNKKRLMMQRSKDALDEHYSSLKQQSSSQRWDLTEFGQGQGGEKEANVMAPTESTVIVREAAENRVLQVLKPSRVTKSTSHKQAKALRKAETIKRTNLEQLANIERNSNLVENLHSRVLFRVKCDRDYDGCHPASAFLDTLELTVPKVSEFGISNSHRGHLNGKVPLVDLQRFMEDEQDDVAFAIVRDVECSETSAMIFRAGGGLRFAESIYMKSAILKDALDFTATCYFHPLENSSSNKPKFADNLIAPLDLFVFHHRKAFTDYAINYPASEAHVYELLRYAEMHHGTDFEEAETLFDNGVVNRHHATKLFKPNELVVSGTHGKPAAFVVQEWPDIGKDGWIFLKCWSFQTDGTGFTRKLTHLSIPPLGLETIKIDTLTVYPLRFASAGLVDLLTARGKKQWDLRTSQQITYQGWNVAKDQYYPDARFMIDHKIYRKMHEQSLSFRFERPKTTHRYDRMPAYASVDQTPTSLIYLLMPPDIHGFYLTEKKWIKLFVENVHSVKWNKVAYERLVLPEQTKDLIRALVAVRTSMRGVKQGLGVAGKRPDLISGKGNGLIMLLHGGPGTGKTLTGESVAEIAEMPLYRVTCGDIGTSADAVEKYLNTVLHLGKSWNCVLLLDEADVFLEERSMADLKRNSLVSVFLRILEYYDGILILTSNRVGMFDEAFKSRIQVALHYENLNKAARKKIWLNFLEMLEEDEEDVNFGEIRFHIDDLAGRELNGRQIRNVLTTARQLAMFRTERLDWQHLDQALAVSSKFSDYLLRMQRHTDDQRARDIGLR